MAEVHLAQEEHEADRGLLEAGLSPPSILNEYGLKAVHLLVKIGIKPPVDKDAGILLDAQRGYFDLHSAGF